MPVVLRFDGYRFYFFSNEGRPREPMHVHVRKAERVAKFWLEPEVRPAGSYRMKSAELFRLKRVIDENKELIRRAWHEHFDR